MKITIDTKEDSHEEIRKVIGMLQKMVGDAQSNGGLFSDSPSEPSSEPSPVSSNAFMNMFGDNSSPSEPSSEPPADSSTLLQDNSEEEPDEPPEIIPY
jgi:hypothetical protein